MRRNFQVFEHWFKFNLVYCCSGQPKPDQANVLIHAQQQIALQVTLKMLLHRKTFTGGLSLLETAFLTLKNYVKLITTSVLICFPTLPFRNPVVKPFG